MPLRPAIRGARPDDYATFAKLFCELGVDEPPFPYERFCSEMLPNTVIAETDEAVVGYAFYRPAKDVVHLSNLVTAPNARRSGVALELMAEVMRRSKEAGCVAITLNVMPSNAAAVRLYERCGLKTIRTNRHLKMDWATLDALEAAASPFADDAREIDPTEDEALEREHNLAAGLLAAARARQNVLRVLRTSSLCAFDAGAGIVTAMRAADLSNALSLLRAIRPTAAKGAVRVLIPIEGQPALADALIAIGAVQRFETSFMKGDL